MSAIRIAVKAPNQKIDDQIVVCSLDWSVLRFKAHLANVYPNKPVSISNVI